MMAEARVVGYRWNRLSRPAMKMTAIDALAVPRRDDEDNPGLAGLERRRSFANSSSFFSKMLSAVNLAT